MTNIKDILLMMLSAMLIENFVFSRFLGCCPFLGVSERPENAFGMGCAVVFVTTISSAATWAVYNLILVPFKLEYLKVIAFILVIASLVQLIEMFMRKVIPALYNALGIYLTLITTNCAVLGATLINVEKGYNFITSIAFGFAASAGFLIAIMIFSGVRVRIEYADPPEAFKGMPILLIAAGLIAMAFSGFSGMKIN